jgi:hypothetical protein
MERRLEGLKRLGGPIGVCTWCRTHLVLALPEPGKSIYRHHWRVEEQVQIGVEKGIRIFYGQDTRITCSAKCSADLAARLRLGYEGDPCEMRFVEQAPCVESS